MQVILNVNEAMEIGSNDFPFEREEKEDEIDWRSTWTWR
jgi:hypothetical protein